VGLLVVVARAMTSSTALELLTSNSAYVRHEDQNAANVTCLFPRSDSGYGSIDGSSTDSPHHPKANSVSRIDGAGSHNDQGTSAEKPNKEASCSLPPRLSKPTQGSCSALAFYRPFLAWKPQQLNLLPGSKDAANMAPFHQKCGGGSLRTPDRFVPRRDSDESSRQVYQTTKPLQDLSPAEKLLRRKRASSTPFSLSQRSLVHASDEARMALAVQPLGQGLSNHQKRGKAEQVC
jgi:hypothetical protein